MPTRNMRQLADYAASIGACQEAIDFINSHRNWEDIATDAEPEWCAWGREHAADFNADERMIMTRGAARHPYWAFITLAKNKRLSTEEVDLLQNSLTDLDSYLQNGMLDHCRAAIYAGRARLTPAQRDICLTRLRAHRESREAILADPRDIPPEDLDRVR